MGDYWDYSIADATIDIHVTIKFSNIKTFSNGHKLYEYAGKEFFKGYSIDLKEYVRKEDAPTHDPLPNNVLFAIRGVLRRELYKSKREDKWIDKGIYIDFTGSKLIQEVNADTIKGILKFENSYQNKIYKENS